MKFRILPPVEDAPGAFYAQLGGAEALADDAVSFLPHTFSPLYFKVILPKGTSHPPR